MTESAKSQNDFFPDGAVPLESILFTEELHRRPSRPPDYEKENRALVTLASALADSPSTIFQTLAETIQDITQCDSAGLSLLTKDGKSPDIYGQRFYWPAICGTWNPHVGGGTPRNFGPCGDVLDQNRALLFRHFERRYPYLIPVIPAAEECLLVPFYVAGKAVGTIWAIMHSDRRKFDAEDDRVMASLGKFASSAYQAFVSIEDLRLQVAEREKAQTELRKLSDGLERQVRSRTDELEQRNKQLAEARARLADEKLRLESSQVCLAEGERLSHTGSWRWEVDSGKVDASQECYAIFGLDPEMDEGSHSLFIDRVHPEDRGDIERVVWAAVNEKRDWEAEFRIVLPGGSIRHLHDIAHCRVSQSGAVEYLGIAMDITERSRAEKAVRRSENALRDVIEAIPTSAWTARSDGSVEFVNRHWREYTGLSGEGSFGSGWQAAVHPEDVGRHVDKWRTSLATGEQFENEVRYRRSADGKYRWFLARAVPLRDEHGNILKWYGISTDIEDRRRAEGMLAGEKRILEMVARGDSLAQILDSLCRLVEEQDQDVLASVSLVHGNRLQHGGAPSLPQTFRNAIDGSVIRPRAGSCGTAAFRGEQVIVSDIATDPLWADYRDAALRHSIRACWSTPVFSSEGNVIATFAMYYRESRSPSTRDKEIIEQISHLAGEAIQRKLAEEKLRRSEAYSAEAQRLSHTGSWHWNVSTGEVAWSQEYCAIFGFDFEKDKPSYQLFIERVHPEDRPKVEQVLWADVREKRDFDGEYRLLLPDCSIKYLHSLGKCSVGQSGDVEYIGAVVDITEHKRAEQELRDSEQKHRVVLEAASDAVISMDDNSTILFANAATLRIFGHDPAELIGKPLTVLMPEFLRKAHEAGFRNYLATRQRHINWQGTELTGLRQNGQEFPVEISFGELTKDGHRIFTGFIRDISERKRAEEERERLRQAQAELAHINRVSTMGELTASLAHEIKQPITAAVTDAKACLRWLDRDQPALVKAREAASRLIRDATRASDIISRIGSLFKKDILRRELVDVNDVIQEMIILLRSEAARYSITIDSQLSDGLPKITADRIQLQQVLMNLMINGIEAMKDLGSTGELNIRSQEDGNRHVMVSVHDNGTGLTLEHVDQIFNAFFTTKPQGTGLGLAISRSIVESHGGRLWTTCDNRPGATFHFTLPIEATAHWQPVPKSAISGLEFSVEHIDRDTVFDATCRPTTSTEAGDRLHSRE